MKELWSTLALFFLLVGDFLEVIRAGIVLVDQLSIAIKEIAKNIIVMDDQMKNIIGETFCDFDRDSIVLSTVVWENTHPAVECRAEQESAIGCFRYIVEGFLNHARVFSSDVN